MDDKKLAELIAESVSSNLQEHLAKYEFGGCCSSRCNEKCGFSPSEHSIKHKKIDELIETVDNAGKSIQSTIAKTITVFLISAVGFGAALIILEFVQNMPRLVGKG